MTRARGGAGALIGRVAAGVFVGATLWLSFGVIALVDLTRLTRVGGLPDWPWLAASVATGVATLAAVAVPATALPPLVVLALIWLPWLPGRVPGAFLMWDGPLEALVWAGALGGVLWFSRDRWVRAWPVWRPARPPLVAGLLSALVFFGAWAVVRERVPSGDEPHYLVISQSLLRDGDVRIENNHRQHDYLAYFDGALKPDFMQRGTNGQIYSIHAPGAAAIVAPAFLLAGYPGAVLTVILLTAIGMALVWQAAFLISGSAAAAWFAWLAVTTAAPVVLHGFTIYPDPIGAAAAMAGVLALVWLEVSPGGTLASWRWVGTGAALAVLPWLHTRFALVAGVLGMAVTVRLVARTGGWRDVLRLLAVPVASAAGWFAYFVVIYGTPNPAAPYGRRPEGGVSFIPGGLTGLLTDQQFGLGPNAPVLVAGIMALVPLARRRPRLAAELLLTVVPYLVVASSYPMWWGGNSAPARFAVVVLPLLAVPLAVSWNEAASAGRAALGTLLALSLAVTASLVGVQQGAFIHNGRDGYSLLLDWVSRTVDLTLALPSVHRDGAATAAVDFVVWSTAAVLAAAVAALGQRTARPLVARLVAWAAVPVAVMLATTITWAERERAVLSPNSSQMWLLRRWTPSVLPRLVQLNPVRGLAVAQLPARLSLGTSIRGRLRPSNDPLLVIPELPAGDYDVFIDGRALLSGTAVVRLGRQDLPLETWLLDGRSAGFSGLVLHVPIDAHSITVTGDDAARAAIRRMTVTPRLLAGRHDLPTALRAARYGPVAVYALDDNAYMEPGAQWVRGEATAAFVVQGDPGVTPVMRLQAGPVDNVITLTAGDWRRQVRLDRGQSADVPLPTQAQAPTAISVASSTGFRPSEQTPGNEDVRWLGVYVTWPVAAGPGAP